MRELLVKYKEIIMYLFFGGLTTLVNILSYSFLTSVINLGWESSNTISWILAVLFAYITNRRYVFESKNDALLKEMVSFFGFRFLSFIMDMVFMFLFVELLFMNDMYAKLIVQGLVIIANYVFSKVFIFKKNCI